MRSSGHHVLHLGRRVRLGGGVAQQLGDGGAGRGRRQHLRPGRSRHERAVDLTILDRLPGGGLVRVPVHVERPFLGAEPRFDRLGGRGRTGHSDRQVAGLEACARPGEERENESHDQRHHEDRRRGRLAFLVSRHEALPFVTGTGRAGSERTGSRTPPTDESSATSRLNIEAPAGSRRARCTTHVLGQGTNARRRAVRGERSRARGRPRARAPPGRALQRDERDRGG